MGRVNLINDNLKNIIKDNKQNENINNFDKLYDNELDNSEADKIDNIKNKSQILNINEIKDESKEKVINKEFNIDEEDNDINSLKELEDNSNENLSLFNNVDSIKEVMDYRKKMLEELEHFEEKENSNLGNDRIKNLKDDNKLSESENANNQDSNIIEKALMTRIAEKDEGKKDTKLIKKIKTKKVINN